MRIATSDIRDDVQKLHCIAGNADKLFVAASLTEDNKPVIFGLSKETGKMELTLSIPFLFAFSDATRIAARDRMLTIYDGAVGHRLCTITGSAIPFEPSGILSVFGLESADFDDSLSVAKVALSVCDHEMDPHIPALFRLPQEVLPKRFVVIERTQDGCKLVAQEDGHLTVRTWKRKEAN